MSKDLDWELARLRAAGVEQVVAFDLTRPELRIPVVRVVIPGFQMPGWPSAEMMVT